MAKVKMKQQPKKKEEMVAGEMTGKMYKKSEMDKWRKSETKSLNDMKAYAAKYAKMTPAQKAVEDAGFRKAAQKVRAEMDRLSKANKKK